MRLLPPRPERSPPHAAAPAPGMQLAPPGERAQRWLFLLAVVLPVAIATAGLAFASVRGGSLRLVGDSLPLTAVATLGGTTAAALCVWAGLRWAMQRQSLQLDLQTIDMAAGFYRCTRPLHTLDLEHARIVDLDEHPELRPGRWSGNSFSVPGFHAGWFRVRGHGRTFAAITEGARVLWLPARRPAPPDPGTSLRRRLIPPVSPPGLLIEPREPAALLARLRELAGGQARR